MTVDEQLVYDEWLQRARPLREAVRWGDTLRDVSRLTLELAVPRPLAKPLAEAATGLTRHAVYRGWDHDPDEAYWRQGSAVT